MREMSGAEAIKNEFMFLDKCITEIMNVYLMGGGAMTLRGLKNSTYDLDLLITARHDFEILSDLLRKQGYKVVDTPVKEYKDLGAALLFDKPSSCRFDLFDRKVIKKLQLTEGMKHRSESVFSGTYLTVNALSNEDIFLFKGVAGRSRDIDDMAMLVETGNGLDFERIYEEFLNQLPVNRGKDEWDLLVAAPRDHPVIAFERVLASLPMTLPSSFTDKIEREADRVYAEYELIRAVEDKMDITDIAEVLMSRNAVKVRSEDHVERIVEGLVAKKLIEYDGKRIRLKYS